MASPASLTFASSSSTVTLGGTAQEAVARTEGRNFLMIHNVDAAEDLWFSVTGTAAVDGAGSVRIPAKSSYFFESGVCPINAVSVIAATTGHKFTIWTA